MTPKVSICIPAYNAERFLHETLDGVRTQTFEDWEIIVTEDGSRDRTEEIVNEFAKTVTRPVRYNRHDPNQGLPATRNAGIAEAKAEWIALLDADDSWKPEHLAMLVQTAVKTNAQIIFSSSIIFDSDTGRELGIRGCEPAWLEAPAWTLFRCDLIIQPSSVLFRRSLIEQLGGFDRAFPICNDFEFWLRAALAKVRFAHTEGATCLYRKHPDAMSMKSADLIAETGYVRQKYLKQSTLPQAEAARLTRQAFYSAARVARSSNLRLAVKLAILGLRCQFGS